MLPTSLVSLPSHALSSLQSSFQATWGSLGSGLVIQSSAVTLDLTHADSSAQSQPDRQRHSTLEDSCLVLSQFAGPACQGDCCFVLV